MKLLMINYLLYGILLDKGQNLECVTSVHDKLKELLDEYYIGLDKVEKTLSANSELEVNKFPELVDSLRMDKDYYKKHKKVIDSFVKMLPNIRKNLEKISRGIMGIE